MHIFAAIADDTRRAVLETLSRGECSVTDLVRRFGTSQPAMSRHLRVLRDQRLVCTRADGQRRMYRIDPRGFRDLDSWLETYRAFWTERLDAFNDFLDQHPD